MTVYSGAVLCLQLCIQFQLMYIPKLNIPPLIAFPNLPNYDVNGDGDGSSYD